MTISFTFGNRPATALNSVLLGAKASSVSIRQNDGIACWLASITPVTCAINCCVFATAPSKSVSVAPCAKVNDEAVTLPVKVALLAVNAPA